MPVERSIASDARAYALGPVALLLAACISGGLIGLAARASDYGPRVAHWVGALGAPWLVVAFVNGALARNRRDAALAGAAAIVAGVVAYYISMWRIEQRTVVDYAAWMIVGWSLAGVVIGAPFGVAGRMAWRGRGRIAAVGLAILAGALLAEAVYVLIVWQNAYAQAVAALELFGAAIVLAATRDRARVASYALPLAVTLLACELIVTAAMRNVGWAGL